MIKGNIWCFFGVHDYKIINSGPFDFMNKGRVVAVSTYYDLQCKRCGKIKRSIMKCAA